MNNNEYNDFKELIDDLISDGVQSYLKDDYVFRGVTGIIEGINSNDTYTVNIGTTVLHDIKNKSGSTLNVGDTVTLLERIGSNYSNCFIFIKNG